MATVQSLADGPHLVSPKFSLMFMESYCVWSRENKVSFGVVFSLEFPISRPFGVLTLKPKVARH